MMMVTDMGDQKRRVRHDAFLLSAKRLKPGGGGGGGSRSASLREKKDRIGERVATLQQLVSPFGKSDTASVLTEATAYIKFLHDQLQEGEGCSLRSRGLCLMPLATTVLIARSNGADIWAPNSK
ncbi:hypothetical protein HPP92_023716 [Vanilla planifolia]|uniref:BHLH domain-containing protein n=1 Tax=Vanilla planifolia TaxID=51239 RepID=A0A835UD43_VANPL|nr:hypothetical protein HPP92_023716 [Vanilla planifolia]